MKNIEKNDKSDIKNDKAKEYKLHTKDRNDACSGGFVILALGLSLIILLIYLSANSEWG